MRNPQSETSRFYVAERRRENGTSKILPNLIFVFPLLMMATTPVENATEIGVTSYVIFLRPLSALLFCLLLFSQSSRVNSAQVLFTALLISLFHLANNVLDFTVSSLLQTLTIGLGILCGGHVRQLRPSMDFFLASLMVVHLFGFFLSWFIWITTAQIVDIHSYLFPFSAHRGGEFLGYARLTGFHIEPGNYAAGMYICVAIRSFIRGRILNFFDFAVIASTTLTFSAWSVVGAGFYFLALAFEWTFQTSRLGQNVRTAFVILFFGMLLLVGMLTVNTLFSSSYFEYLTVRFDADVGSAKYRAESWDAWTAGMVSVKSMFGHAVNDGFCSYCKAPQDLGAFLNMAYYMGFLFTGVLTFLLVYRLFKKFSLPVFLVFLPLLLIKLYYYEFLIWVVVGVILFAPRANFNERNVRQLRRS